MRRGWKEIPPTAGLPLRWRDFLASRGASFETRLKRFLNVPAIQLECSGTAALIVSLTVLSRRSVRRSVIVPAYTCPLVVLAIAHCGLKPVLCDLREDHFDLCPEMLRQLCDDDTLAVVPTHLGGRVADLAVVEQISNNSGALIIEDAAQALGARWRDHAVGTVGDIGFYSLAVGKGLTLYEGGVLVAREQSIREDLRETGDKVSPYRVTWEMRRLFEVMGYAALYRPILLSLAYGLPLRRALTKGKLIEAVGDDFSSDIPLHKLGAWRRTIGANAIERLPAFLSALTAQAAVRKHKLATLPGVTVIDDAGDTQGTWPYFMVLMPTAQARDRALASLWRAGVGVSRLFIHALPDYPYLEPLLGSVSVPRARDFAARMLTVSNSPWLQEQEFSQICSELERCAE